MELRDFFAMIPLYAKREEGQTMAEYGVVLAVITLGIITALGLLAVAISGKFTAIKDVLAKAV